MAKLRISDNQKSLIITAIDAHLENAFLNGVDTESTATVLEEMDKYDELSTTPVAPATRSERAQVKDVFRQIVAAVVKVLEIDRPLPATKFSGTVALRKLTDVTGTDGSLTVVDGIITAYTPPT